MGLGKTYSTKYLLDSNNSSGVAGQVLSTTSTGIDWVNASTVPGAGLWLENGNDIYNSNSGNVGIGNTNPNFKLQVSGSVALDVMPGHQQEGIVRIGRYDANTSRYNDIKSFVSSTAASNYLVFSLHGGVENATVDVMKLLGNGNVGIGTTNPSSKLTVTDGMDGSNSQTGLEFIPQDSNNRNIIFSYDRSSNAYKQLNFDASDFRFNTGGGTKVVINSSGNVGIGTTTPDVGGAGSSSTVLSVIETAGNRRGILELGDNQNADTGGIGSVNFVGTYQDAGHKVMAEIRASGSGSTSGKRGSYISVFTKEDNVANISESMRIATDLITFPTVSELRGDISGDKFAIGNMGSSTSQMMVSSRGFLTLNVSNTGSGKDATERMRIQSSGDVGIGKTTSLSNHRLSIKKNVSVQLGLYYDESKLFAIGVTSNGDAQMWAFNGSSYKNIILAVDGGVASAGNVGIGRSTNIDAPLTVQANGSAGTINLIGRQNGVFDESILGFYDNDGTTRKGYILNSGGNMFFATGNGSENMTILSNGSVGIGLTQPTSELQVNGAIAVGPSSTKSEIQGPTAGNANMTFAANAGNVNTGIAEFSFTNSLTGSATRVERMHISSAGAIKFNNYNSTNNTGSPTHILGTDASGNVVKSTAGSSIGPWLPLAAGSGDPLTGNLYITKADTPVIELKDTTNNKTLLIGVDDSNAFIRSGVDETFLLQVAGGNTAITMLNGGNVGIGTTTPDYKLDVNGNIRSSTVTVYDGMGGTETGIGASSAGGNLRLYSGGTNRVTVTNTSRTMEIYGLDTVGSNFVQFFNSAGTAQGYIGMGTGGANDFIIAQESNAPIRFFNGGTERMRIAFNGNVGIGTTDPDAKLTISKTSFSTTFTSADSYIRIGKGENGQNGYQFIGFGYNNGAADQVPAYIGFQQTGTPGNYTKGALVFGTRNVTTNTAPTERMRITGAGEVLFSGTVGINISTTPAEKLELNGNMLIQGDLKLGTSSSIALKDQPAASAASGSGTIVNWSVSESVTQGDLYAVKTNGGWIAADADTETTATYMLALALSGNASAGMLLQGFFYKSSHGFVLGAPLYISNTAGAFSNTRPTGSGDYVRIIGYATSANYIYFDPDKTWIKLT